MVGLHELWLFVLAGLLLNITPGPDTVYIVGRSIQLGWRGGALAAIGVCCGCLLHVLAAVAGLSALLMASAAAFTVVKLAGAGYLVIIGVQMLRSGPGALASAAGGIAGKAAPLRQVFWQGVMSNALNPKVALFFLAFLPQFVPADSPHKALAFLELGLIFIANSTLWCLFVAGFAARAAHRIRKSTGAIAWINRALGALFIYLGIRIALLEAR